MNIDRILSRFRIQTKVLIFIFPFVVSITAVGVTGLYASGLLQGRMEISNSVLQSLSGFRDVGAAMKSFLDDATPEKRDELAQLLKNQGATLNATLEQLDPNAEGRADLENAAKSVDGIVARIGDLWAQHEKETTLDKQIRTNLNIVTAAQMLLVEESTKMQKQMRNDESAAKSMLREADRISTSAKFLTDLSNAFMKAKTPEEKFAVVKTNIAELKKRLRILTPALPEGNKAVAKSLGAAIGELDKMVQSGDMSIDGIQKISTKLSSFHQTSVYLGVAAALKMKNATQKFSELDAPLVKAEGILADSRKLVTSGYSIQIEMARFLEDPTEVNRKRLYGEFEIVRKDVQVLKGSAGDQAFFPEIENAPDEATKEALIHEKWFQDTTRLTARLNGLDNFGGYFPQYRDLNDSHCTTIVDFQNGDIQEQALELSDFIDSVLDGNDTVLDASESSDEADRAKPFNFLYWLVDKLLG